MLSLTNRRNGRCARWCAIVVLMAVCSLAISVATRYGSTECAPAAAKVSRIHAVQEHGRQRLTKDAANWMPPVIVSAVLQEPASYTPGTCDGPALPDPSFATRPCYRPPPCALS